MIGHDVRSSAHHFNHVHPVKNSREVSRFLQASFITL